MNTYSLQPGRYYLAFTFLPLVLPDEKMVGDVMACAWREPSARIWYLDCRCRPAIREEWVREKVKGSEALILSHLQALNAAVVKAHVRNFYEAHFQGVTCWQYPCPIEGIIVRGNHEKALKVIKAHFKFHRLGDHWLNDVMFQNLDDLTLAE